MWQEMKARWINEKDYETTDQLFYTTNLVLNEIGKSLKMNFKKYNLILTDYLIPNSALIKLFYNIPIILFLHFLRNC